MWVFKRLYSSKLVRGSLFIFISNNLFSFGNFLYNLFMARMLGPELYGDLGAIFSILTLSGVPLGIIQLYVTKQVAVNWGRKSLGKISGLFSYLTPKLFIFSFISTMVVLIGNRFIGKFLGLDSFWVMIVISLYFLFSGPSVINKGIIQGTLSFAYITLNSLVEVLLKISTSILLVYLNFQLIGALLGPLIGGIIVYFMSIFELKIILRSVKQNVIKITEKKIFASFMPVFFATVTLTSFLNIDIILVRHFFASGIAGEYVALSTVGRIIFYAVGPVLTVMFPMISSRVSGGLPYILPLLGTLVFSLVLSIGFIFIYFLFPRLIIDIIFGSQYYGIIPYLGLFSFFIIIYTFNSILNYFLLSISYYDPMVKLFLISLLQGVFISIFHSSLYEVIWVNILVSFLYLIVISYYVWKKESKIILRLFYQIIARSVNS